MQNLSPNLILQNNNDINIDNIDQIQSEVRNKIASCQSKNNRIQHSLREFNENNNINNSKQYSSLPKTMRIIGSEQMIEKGEYPNNFHIQQGSIIFIQEGGNN